MIAYSALGNQGAVWIAAGVADAVVRHSARPAWTTAATVWGTLSVNYAIKRAVRRTRPEGNDLPAPLIRAPRSYSFPSAHAAMSAAAAVVLPPAAIPFAALMIVSRVYLAVHYPSDVAVGALVGLACGLGAAMLGA